MFETLFKYPGVIRRYREGRLLPSGPDISANSWPRAWRRRRSCAGRGTVLFVAVELQRWPPAHCFNEDEVETLAAIWALGRFACGRASSPRWPTEHFRFAATEFLRSLGRLRLTAAPEVSRYDAELARRQ